MLFRYETQGAYHYNYELPSLIAIYNRDINNLELSNYHGIDQIITIDVIDMDKIFHLLMNEKKLYDIKGLPSTPVLDGVQEKFFFSNGLKKVELITFNTNYYFDLKKEDVPDDVYVVLDLFYKIAEILKKYNVKLRLEK